MEQNVLLLLKIYDLAMDIVTILSVTAIALIAANINSNH